MKKIIFYILIMFVLIPSLSKAQDSYTLLEPLPCIEGTNQTCDGDVITKVNLNDYIGYVFKFSIALAAFLAVIMIIYGGVAVMTSETPFKIADGKQKIYDAITGLLMVLASYLILATIDPRLVEINTSIDPIKIDTKDVQVFRDQLTDDLKSLSAENRLRVQEISSSKTRLETEKKDLDAKYARGEISDYDYEREAARINQDLVGLNNERNKFLAEGKGLEMFNRARGIIIDLNATQSDKEDLARYLAEPVGNFLTDGKLPTNSPNFIQNQYNLKINEISATNPEEAVRLGWQRDFYIAQAKEEYTLSQKTTNTTIVDELGTYDNRDMPYLNRKLKEYQDNLRDADKPRQYGISPEVYTRIMQTRIDTINKTLALKVK